MRFAHNWWCLQHTSSRHRFCCVWRCQEPCSLASQARLDWEIREVFIKVLMESHGKLCYIYINIIIYIYIYDRGLIYRIEVQDICISLQWVNYNDLKRRPKPIDDGECKGNHPHMGELFRLVNYCNLPRWEMDGEILGK